MSSCFKKFRKNSEIFLGCLHHTVTETPSDWQSLQTLAQKIESWHSKKSWAGDTKSDGRFGFSFISYHVLIGDGVAILAQPIPTVRFASSDCCAGKKSANRHGVHFALLGNFQNSIPSERQLATLVCVWGEIEKSYGLDLKIVLHRDQAKLCRKATACPGEEFVRWYRNGGRKKLVEWINHFKKTGELPFGFLWRRERNGWIVWRDDEQKKITELEERIRELSLENTQLRIARNSLQDQIKIKDAEIGKLRSEKKKLSQRVSELEKQLEDRIQTILVQRAKINRLQTEAMFCRRIRKIVDKILQRLRTWLARKESVSKGR